MHVLSSLKVLDFSTLLPGPFASMMLADMGADVVHVEAPDRPDLTRMTPPLEGDVSAAHAFLNRSKKSITLNLKAEGAADVVKRLVQNYDIVLEQFRPGVMDRLGVGYEALSAANPSLIYCALTGYGQTGPLKDRAGHDNNYLSLAGVMSHSGSATEGPQAQGVQIADVAAGSFCAVIGILAAVQHRNQTGEGQAVDVSMYDGALALNAFAAAQYFATGESPGYESMMLNGGSHYGYYRTKDNRYMSVGSLEPKFWLGLCDAIGQPELADKLAMPGPAMAPVKAAIAEAFAQKTQEEWCAIFSEYDVCVEPVLNMEEAFAHPHAQARNMVAEVPRSDGSTSRQAGAPIKFSKSAPRYAHIGAGLGEHTETVLNDAGFTTDEISALRAKNVFG